MPPKKKGPKDDGGQKEDNKSEVKEEKEGRDLEKESVLQDQ